MGYPGNPDGSIRSARLDGSDITTILGGGVINTPKQLIVSERDGVHDKPMLYFCDREGLTVYRCGVDGSNLEPIFIAGDPRDAEQAQDQRKWCVGVAVAPRQGKVYWTLKGPSKGMKGRIMRANIEMPQGSDAFNRQDVECIWDGLPEPIDLEIDEQGGYLYWTDRGEIPFGNTLARVSLATLDEHAKSDLPPNKRLLALRGIEVLGRNLHEAIGLKLDTINRHIYSTDLGGAVYRFDMDQSLSAVEKKGLSKVYDCQGDAAFTGIAILYQD
jgi:hypothetical protein